MVTIAPKEKGWSDVGEAFGTGFVSSYQNRSDEAALQNAIASLPPDASAQDIIKAVTGAKTYNPESKKTMLGNYLKANEIEEDKIHRKAGRELEGKKHEETVRHNKSSEKLTSEKYLSEIAKANARASKQNKPGISEKPSTPEEVEALRKTLNNPKFLKADNIQKRFMLAEANVSKGTIDSTMKGIEEAQKIGIEEEDKKYKQALDIHEKTEKYHTSIEEQASSAKKQKQYIKQTLKAVQKTSPWSAANVLKNLGFHQLSEAFLTKDQATINSAVVTFLEGAKEIFGVRLSDADLRVLQDKLPSFGKTKAANEEILAIMDKYADQSILKGKIADQISNNSKYKFRDVDFKQQVNKKFDYEIEPVMLKDPNTGIEFESPRYRVEDWIRAGAEIADEQ